MANAILIGIFDGVHQGHQELIRIAQSKGEVTALTFYPHPTSIIAPERTPRELIPLEDRIELLKKYKNYDLTFSYSGYNMDECFKAMDKKVRVAVVFKKLPTKFWDKKVIDGDAYDMRYHDKKNVIVGLKYKITRKKLTKNKFVVEL